MESVKLFFDFLLGRMVVDQVKSYGVDTAVSSLQTRMSEAETNIGILTDGNTPVQGSYVFGDWSHDGILTFAAWTA